MKRQALDHTKMDLLMRKLRLPRWGCVGILESLWHLTAREAPRGDIGRLSNERIAIGIDWRGATNSAPEQEADRLIRALAESEWIDAHPIHRFVIHDWNEHADDTLKKYLKRNGLSFACLDMSGHGATNPDMAPLPVPVPVPVPAPGIAARRTPAPVATMPQPIDYSARYRAIYDRHIVVGFMQDGEYEYCQAIQNGAQPPEKIADTIDAAHAEWMKFFHENPHEYKPGIGKWLKEGYWTRRPRAREPTEVKLSLAERARIEHRRQLAEGSIQQ